MSQYSIELAAVEPCSYCEDGKAVIYNPSFEVTDNDCTHCGGLGTQLTELGKEIIKALAVAGVISKAKLEEDFHLSLPNSSSRRAESWR